MCGLFGVYSTPIKFLALKGQEEFVERWVEGWLTETVAYIWGWPPINVQVFLVDRVMI